MIGTCNVGSSSGRAVGTNLGTKLAETAETRGNQCAACHIVETADLRRWDAEEPVKPSPVGS